ncbi:MAG TPA: outer membrane beta-barrel protein [Solimonas sp.]
MKFVNWLGLGVLAMSSAANAGVYVGAAGSMTQYEYDNVDDATGFTAFAGFRSESLPLMFEVAYADFGDHDITDDPGVSIGFSGMRASAGYFGRLSPTGSGVWIKGGYYKGDSEGKAAGLGSDELSSSGFTWGVGGDWKITRNLGLRLDLESYMGVKDFNGYPVSLDNESDVTVISLGLVFELPSRGSAASSGSNSRSSYTPPPAPAPAPAPTYAPTPAAAPPEPVVMQAPAPAPQPVLAPAPVAPVVAARASAKPGMPVIGVRHTSQPTALLRQPRAGSPVDASLAAGTEVQLMQRVPNALGIWWYVYANGVAGWVNDSALAPQ